MLKISSLNANGIRAAHRHGFTDWVDQTAPDIICLQELRAMEEQVPGPIRKLDYHEVYHTAQKKGYSGVGILSRKEPVRIQKGIGVDWIDNEGRILLAEFKNITVMSIYAPSGTTGSERQDLKMEFLDVFLPFAQKYLGNSKPVVICGVIIYATNRSIFIIPKEIKTLPVFSRRKESGLPACWKPVMKMSIDDFTKESRISTAGGATGQLPKIETKAGELTIT